MTKNIMIDIETLGTNYDSQVISIGACVFNAEAEILKIFYVVIKLDDDTHVNVTPGTLKFWSTQDLELFNLLTAEGSVNIMLALSQLSTWVDWEDTNVWANGTKFDIGMLESLYKTNDLVVPWKHNADRCMRTIKQFAGSIDIPFEGKPHHALDDAIWQAQYVAAACNKLGLKL